MKLLVLTLMAGVAVSELIFAIFIGCIAARIASMLFDTGLAMQIVIGIAAGIRVTFPTLGSNLMRGDR